MDRVVRFEQHGDIDTIRVHKETPRALSPGEVLIRVHAYALNPSDALIRSGRFFERPELPSRVGYDAAGVVAAVSQQRAGISVGDRVFTLPAFLQGPYGVQGSWAIVPEYAIAPLPLTMDFGTGAALGVQYSTAYFALMELGGLQRGDTVYVTAAAGNTGLAAVQVAHAGGARVAAVARRASEVETLRDRGVDVIVADGSDDDVALALLDATDGAGVKMIYDGVGGPRARLYGDVLARAGVIVVYGFLGGAELPLSGVPLYRKGARLEFYQVFHFTGIAGTSENVAALARLKAFLARELHIGTLAPEIGARFPLERVHDAHAFAENGGARGKTIVVLDE